MASTCLIRWRHSDAAVVLLVLLLPVTVLGSVLDETTGAWWPGPGLVTVAVVLTARRRQPLVALVAAALTAPLLALVYDTGPLLGAVAALILVGPGFLAGRLLQRREHDVDPVSLRGFATARYHLVLLACSGLVGLLTALTSLPTEGWVVAAHWCVAGFLSTLTSLVVLLPLALPASDHRAAAGSTELWAQRAALVALTLLVPLVDLVLLLAFPLLGWAAMRASRREAHVQVGVFSFAVYALSVAGAGLLAPQRAAQLYDPVLATVPLFVYLAAVGYLTVPLAMSVEHLATARDVAARTASTLEQMLEGARGSILILVDPEGRIQELNAGASRILGYEPEEVRGRTSHLLHDEQEVARVAHDLGVAPDLHSVLRAQIGSGERRDHVLVCKDGGRRLVSLGVAAVRDPAGEVLGYVASGDDVTERVRTQRALEGALDREHRSLERLREVDHVKQELVSTVSHELRTPITSITGYAELLSDASLGELTRSQRDAVQRIERNAVRLRSLVDDLLTLSRSESGRLQLARLPLDLRTVVRGGWEVLEEQLRHRDLATSLRLPPEPVEVLGDCAALERVVVNLAGNAVKFTPDGGAVTVTLTRASDGTALLLVTDTGIGISFEDQDQLFTRFFRSTTATDAAIQGTGLGLSIVHALVSQHGGRVAVRSSPGQGTRVSVELPTS